MYMCPHKTHIVAITMFYILAFFFLIFIFKSMNKFPTKCHKNDNDEFFTRWVCFWGYYCGVMVNIIYDDVVDFMRVYIDSFDASIQNSNTWSVPPIKERYYHISFISFREASKKQAISFLAFIMTISIILK